MMPRSARSYLGWHPTRNPSHHRCHVARVQGWRPCFITLADLRCALSRITAEASPPVDCNHLGSQTSCSSTRLGAFRRHRTTPPRPSGGGHGKIHSAVSPEGSCLRLRKAMSRPSLGLYGLLEWRCALQPSNFEAIDALATPWDTRHGGYFSAVRCLHGASRTDGIALPRFDGRPSVQVEYSNASLNTTSGGVWSSPCNPHWHVYL